MQHSNNRKTREQSIKEFMGDSAGRLTSRREIIERFYGSSTLPTRRESIENFFGSSELPTRQQQIEKFSQN